MENRKESAGFDLFMVNNNNPSPPTSIVNQNSSFGIVTGNLPMAAPANGGGGFNRASSYQYPNLGLNPNPSFQEIFYDPLETDFNLLSLSNATPHVYQSPFLTPANGGGGGSGNNLAAVDHHPYMGMFDMGMSMGMSGGDYSEGQMISNVKLERLRIESAVRGQLGMYMQQQTRSQLSNNLDGFDFPSTDFDFDNNNLYNSARNLNLNGNVNQPVIRPPPPRYDFQSQSPYDFGSGGPNSYSFNGNRISTLDNNPIQARGAGRSTPRGYSSPLMSSLYSMTGNGNGNATINGNGSVYQSRPRPKFPASLEDMRGKVMHLATDQHSSQLLQKRIEEKKPEDIDLIFSEVKDHISMLMVHQFGNYVIQKLFEVCDQAKITQILALVISHDQTFVKICLDIHGYGTRAMQKLLERLTTQEQRTCVVSVLERVSVTVPLTMSANGNHVIQHCLKFFPSEEIEKILHVAADYCLPIATNQSGCCVLQLCIARAPREAKERLVAEITANAVLLAQDPFGNYVLQYVIEMAVPRYTSDILAVLAGSFTSLSMDKYGSNVVEKCIKEFSEDNAAEVIKEIIYSPNFLMVLQSAYGNYVAQSALIKSKGALRETVNNLIIHHYPFLHSHPHGKRVLARARGSKHTVHKRV